MPSMVSDVSAMLVEKTIFRPGGPPGLLGGGAGSLRESGNNYVSTGPGSEAAFGSWKMSVLEGKNIPKSVTLLSGFPAG